jgi:ubiquinone/menaquinone biosynthesis C-methylase UbiE
MMDIQQSYNLWAGQYDTNHNKTRDLEAVAIREMLEGFSFDHCLEIGCGTGKNTQWLATKAKQITAIDLSEEMLARARKKVKSGKVTFIQADINADWNFVKGLYDLVSFSLVLEHIEHLGPIFEKAARVLQPGGCLYLGELHPFRQYGGTKARFDTAEGQHIVRCYNHHLSDFTQAAISNTMRIVYINEYFDEVDRNNPPRIITMLFKKN